MMNHCQPTLNLRRSPTEKITQLLCILLLFAQQGLLYADNENSRIVASFQIQITESMNDLFSDSTNVDNTWGRLNFGVRSEAENFRGALNLRMYPAGFGYEVLSGLEEISDPTTTQIEKIQIEKAFVAYNFGRLTVKLGRYYTSVSHTLHAGDYLAKDPGMGYVTRLFYHNAMEWKLLTGPLQSELLLGVRDRHLNRSYLRILETLALRSGVKLGIGYRSNLFERIQNRHVDIHHHLTTLVEYQWRKGSPVYAEVGFRDRGGADYEIPVHVGAWLPSWGLLDRFAVESEWVTNGRDAPESDFLMGTSLTKRLPLRAKVELSLYTNRKLDEPIGGIRFTGVIH